MNKREKRRGSLTSWKFMNEGFVASINWQAWRLENVKIAMSVILNGYHR